MKLPVTTPGKGFGFLFEKGCGKTLTAIAVAGTGYKLGHLRRVLIVAPTSVCAVWPKEFQEYADFPYTVRTLLGTKAQRLKELDDLEKWPFPALRVAVINYESTWREGIFERLQAFDADLIICDESQRIKTFDAAQSKAMHRLGDQARYKLILSGTPVQNDAMDIFSQYRFLDPTIFGQNYYTFRSRYAVMGGFNKKQVVGYRDMDELIRKEHSIAYRVTKEEAVDLPEQTFENRIVTLGKKERGVYNQLKRDSVAQMEGGGQVTATTVLTRLLRLQQFTGGFLMEDEAARPQLVSRGKLDALSDILHDYVLEGRKKEDIQAMFTEIRDYVQGLSDGKNGAHTAAIALVALADAMIDSWLFDQRDAGPNSRTDMEEAPGQSVREESPVKNGTGILSLLSRLGIIPESWERAKRMAADILDQQQTGGSGDVNENAVQFIVDWVLANKAFFNHQTIGTSYGMMSGEGGEAKARLFQAAHCGYLLASLGRDPGRPAAGGLLYPQRLCGLPALALCDGGPALDRPRRGVFVLSEHGQVRP